MTYPTAEARTNIKTGLQLSFITRKLKIFDRLLIPEISSPRLKRTPVTIATSTSVSCFFLYDLIKVTTITSVDNSNTKFEKNMENRA